MRKLLICVTLGLSWLCSNTAHASTIYLQTTPTDLLMQPFDVYVAVSGFRNIAGFEFDLSYDSSLLSAVAVSEGNFLPYTANTTYFYGGSIDNIAGSVSGVSDITASGVSAASGGTLATVEFVTLPSFLGGQTPSNIVLSNFQLIDGNGNLVNPDVVNGTVIAGVPGAQLPNDPPAVVPATGSVGAEPPPATPEPSTGALVSAVGLLVLGSWRLRKRQRRR